MQIDLLKRQVTRDGTAIILQPREFKILEELMRECGKVVTRTMLLERVWNYHFDPQTNIVETHISRLRSKLNEGGKPDPIETVRGVGYRFAGMRSWSRSAAYRIAFANLAFAIGLALLGLVVFGAMHLAFTDNWMRRYQTRPRPSSTNTGRTGGELRDSIAVRESSRSPRRMLYAVFAPDGRRSQGPLQTSSAGSLAFTTFGLLIRRKDPTG